MAKLTPLSQWHRRATFFASVWGYNSPYCLAGLRRFPNCSLTLFDIGLHYESGADPGICERGVPLTPLLLEGGPLNQLGVWRNTVSSPVGPGPKTNLDSKAVRKPLVAIILNIPSIVVYVFEEIKLAMVSL